jgi:hypothetical protein
MRSFVVSVSAAVFLSIAAPAVAPAAIGGPAQRGDNCTAIPRYSIGVGIPGSDNSKPDPISAQTVIVQDGWRVVGWILTGRSGALMFAPYDTDMLERSRDPYVDFPIPRLDHDSFGRTYARIRESLMPNSPGEAAYFVPDLKSFALIPCFVHPLPPKS